MTRAPLAKAVLLNRVVFGWATEKDPGVAPRKAAASPQGTTTGCVSIASTVKRGGRGLDAGWRAAHAKPLMPSRGVFVPPRPHDGIVVAGRDSVASQRVLSEWGTCSRSITLPTTKSTISSTLLGFK